MYGRWKFVLMAIASLILIGGQSSYAEDSDHRHDKNGHHRRVSKRHHRHQVHRRERCARGTASAQGLEKIPEQSVLPSWPLGWGPSTQQPQNYTLSGFHGGRACTNTIPTLVQMMPRARAECFARLFYKENTSCSPHTLISPAQGNNPHWGIGLCTIELSPALRKSRPPACADISNTASQVVCCVGIYDQTRGSYFGPIIRGETPRC